MADDLTLDDLIAFGADWAKLLNEGPGDTSIELSRPVLQQYLAAANDSLLRQREQAQKRRRASGGRPPGGMGEQVQRYIENGLSDDRALRIVARAFGKPIASVAKAHERAKTSAKNPTGAADVCKKPPDGSNGYTKNTPYFPAHYIALKGVVSAATATYESQSTTVDCE